MKIIETNWKWNSSMSTRGSTDYIALHHAAAVTCSAQDIDNWHKNNGWSGIGYHYFVRKNGSIYRGRPEWALGAHVSGMNICSLGICAEGDYDKEQTMPDAQKSAIIALIKDVKSRYPNAKVVGHRDIGSSDCPGKYYPMSEMINYFNNESEEEPMTAEERTKFNELVNIVSELQISVDKLANPMIYNYIDKNMPEWAREGVRYCLDNGFIEGTGDGLGLDSKDLKYCTIIMRLHKAVK